MNEVCFLCRALRASPSSLSKLESRLDSLGATQEVPQDTCCNSRKKNPSLSFPPQLEMRPYSPVVTQEESRGFPRNKKGGLTSLRQHERFSDVSNETVQKLKVTHSNTRNTMRFPSQCEMRLDSPAVTGEESQGAPRERLLLNHAKTLGFLAPGGEEFNLGPEIRLDRSELLCNKVLLKYKGDRESY